MNTLFLKADTVEVTFGNATENIAAMRERQAQALRNPRATHLNATFPFEALRWRMGNTMAQWHGPDDNPYNVASNQEQMLCNFDLLKNAHLL